MSERVCALLLELCRGQGAFGATPGDLERHLNFRRRFLMHDREGWTYLAAWACRRAAGESIASLIVERGWSRHAFETGWRRAAAAIAAGLELERVNSAALDQADDSEARNHERGRLPPPMMPQPILLVSA